MKLVTVTTECQSNPELFFSIKPTEIREAKEICSRCPKKEACLRQAEESGEVHGVWGGKNFSTGLFKSVTTVNNRCKKNLHHKEGPGRCSPCATANKKLYNQKLKDAGITYNRKKRSWKKNFIGKNCSNGHLLTIDNTRIRQYDKALMCNDCLRKVRPKIIPSVKKGLYP